MLLCVFLFPFLISLDSTVFVLTCCGREMGVNSFKLFLFFSVAFFGPYSYVGRDDPRWLITLSKDRRLSRGVHIS